MTRLLWNASSSSWGLVILYYTQLYGAQILLVTILSAVTVYRREMSCNHVYTEDEEDTQRSSNQETTSTVNDPGASNCGQRAPHNPNFWDDLFWDDLDRPLLAVFVEVWASYYLGSMQLKCGSVPCCIPTPCRLDKRGQESSESKTQNRDFLTQELPPDLQVHVLSYLHPRDVVTFACASKSCRSIVDAGETSMALWKTLWYRDYAWIILKWEVGRQALHRSRQNMDEVFCKRFYFLFGQSYLNYVLAGRNTTDQCLVGLHGNIYDITPFLDSHPGSPDTLLVHSGRDASAFFEDMGHSVGARRLSRTLCLVVDAACKDGDCGLRPTSKMTGQCGLLPEGECVATPLERSNQPKRPGTLQRIRTEYDAQEQEHLRRVTRQLAGDPNVLSHANVYFDPMCKEWRAWYTDMDLQTVFVNQT